MNNPIMQWALEILQNTETSVREDLRHVFELVSVLPERLKVNANPLESIFSVIFLEQGKQTSISKRYIPWCDLDTKKIVYPKADNSNSSAMIPQDLEWERFQSVIITLP